MPRRNRARAVSIARAGHFQKPFSLGEGLGGADLLAQTVQLFCAESAFATLRCSDGDALAPSKGLARAIAQPQPIQRTGFFGNRVGNDRNDALGGDRLDGARAFFGRKKPLFGHSPLGNPRFGHSAGRSRHLAGAHWWGDCFGEIGAAVATV
jgi:hypothetical protein